MTITIIGLGPGEFEDLSCRALHVLQQTSLVYLRTEQHACVAGLAQAGVTYQSFDALYETNDGFEQVYQHIVERVITAAQSDDVAYAVPGDPLVGESTTARLIDAATLAGIPIQIVHGISFIEPSLRLLGVDALDGLQVLDGLQLAAMHHPPINPDFPALVGQVYSGAVASEVKLTLMNQYPDDFMVTLLHAAGTAAEIVEALPLYEIDRSVHIGHMTSLYVPALGQMSGFEQFQEIVAHLRAPEGCPWDREQTHESLRRFIIEEAYEVVEAIDTQDTDALVEELGDVLLQIVLHAQIGVDDGEFSMADVMRHINAKMIRRHPHVWGDVDVNGNPEQVVTNWEALKRNEKAANGKADESLLDSIPAALPALMQAYQYQLRAAKVGFDWPTVDDVMAKFDEELEEVRQATSRTHLIEEFGDLLLVLVNWARKLDIEPEMALREANAKFRRRFGYIEDQVRAAGQLLTDHTLAELDALWDEAKTKGL